MGICIELIPQSIPLGGDLIPSFAPFQSAKCPNRPSSKCKATSLRSYLSEKTRATMGKKFKLGQSRFVTARWRSVASDFCRSPGSDKKPTNLIRDEQISTLLLIRSVSPTVTNFGDYCSTTWLSVNLSTLGDHKKCWLTRSTVLLLDIKGNQSNPLNLRSSD